MSAFVLKLILTPLLIAGATIVQRKWGSAWAGLLAGLPLVSGSVSVFLAVEHGPSFAAGAALGTLLGTVAMCSFCVAYARSAAAASWPVATLAGLLACAAVTAVMSFVPANLVMSAAVSVAGVGLLLLVMGRPIGAAVGRTIMWWDLPARIAVATALVVVITSSAGWLGPRWSGLLASLPVMSTVLGAFTHSRVGSVAAHALLRGVCVSAFGVLAFYLVLGGVLGRLGTPLAYILAVCAALGVTALCRPLALGPRNSRPAAGALAHRGDGSADGPGQPGE